MCTKSNRNRNVDGKLTQTINDILSDSVHFEAQVKQRPKKMVFGLQSVNQENFLNKPTAITFTKMSTIIKLDAAISITIPFRFPLLW